jgi:hypothetical protein
VSERYNAVVGESELDGHVGSQDVPSDLIYRR